VTELALETNCGAVQQLLDRSAEFLLIDCRETEEYQLGSIAGAQLLPMSELATRAGELDGQQETHIVVYCHHGMRSAQVASWLRQQGFGKAQSMAGGIDQWSLQIDPSVARY